MNTLTSVDGSHLIKEENKEAITSQMFPTKKRDGRIKCRSCADGHVQRGKFEKQDAAYPTVATESIFITSAIDSHERRDVVTIYIPGAFLHADSDNNIIMVLKVNVAILMCHVDPKLYRK